jgi:hypothetical protein
LLDLTGQRFGRLLVVGFSHKEKRNKTYSYYWFCNCDCGTENKVVCTSHLRGKTKSCGCLHREKLRNSKRKNIYNINNNLVTGITEKGEKFFFDIEDFELVTKDNYYWAIEDGYVRTRHCGQNKKRYRISMHRLIMDAKENEIIDHINMQRNDNRKLNLRITDKSKNAINSKLPINNTSGVKGVCFHQNKWEAKIRYNYKTIYLGSYKTIKEAADARKQAEQKYFGEFAYQPDLEIIRE